MKTSLNIDDSLYLAAREESLRSGKALSEIITEWARLGRERMARQSTRSRRFKPVDLGSPAQIDLSSRATWMEMLER